MPRSIRKGIAAPLGCITSPRTALPDGTVLPLGEPTALPEGVVTINPDGTVEFMAAPNFNGSLSLGYTLSDGNGGVDMGALIIHVTPVNDAPVLDLNGSDTGVDAAVSIANNDPSITVIPAIEITDIDSETLTSADVFATITGLSDGADERIMLGGQDLGFGTGGASFDVMIGETLFTVTSDGASFAVNMRCEYTGRTYCLT